MHVICVFDLQHARAEAMWLVNSRWSKHSSCPCTAALAVRLGSGAPLFHAESSDFTGKPGIGLIAGHAGDKGQQIGISIDVNGALHLQGSAT